MFYLDEIILALLLIFNWTVIVSNNVGTGLIVSTVIMFYCLLTRLQDREVTSVGIIVFILSILVSIYCVDILYFESALRISLGF